MTAEEKEGILRESIRASGDAICPICSQEFRRHPYDQEILSYQDLPFLVIACNGKRLKL